MIEKGFNMNEDINVLDEINKGCSMGVDAINYILDKVEDNKFSDFWRI